MSEELKEQQKKDEQFKAFSILSGADRNPELVTLVTANKTTDIDQWSLEGKDYLALFIALLQTVFSPILVLMALLFGFTIFFRIVSIVLWGV
ncbi:MAG: hypothetical protein ACW981_09610 [Candidatus Hodarchaeales archaeon]|jgi:hypothetical protein